MQEQEAGGEREWWPAARRKQGGGRKGGAGHLMKNHFGQRSVIFTLEVFLLSSYEAA